MSRAYPAPRLPRRPEGAKSARRPASSATSHAKLSLTAVWVGADAVKVLAGPPLASFVFNPATEDDLASSQEGLGETTKDAVRAHEYRARDLLSQRQPVASLAELEAALCLCEKRGLESPSDIRRRWQTLTSSAISWSLDYLADAGLASEKGGSGLAESDQALEMLCLAELLTRKEVAENFGAQGAGNRPFFRAITHAGLGAYYQLRQKPRAAISFLEQAASGAARWVHPAILLNLSAAYLLLKESGLALAALSQAVLSLRSSTGRLCGEGVDEVDAAAEAARTAVAAVLGPSVSEDTGPQSAALLEMDPFGQGLALMGEDGLERIVPGTLLDTPESSDYAQGSAGRAVRQRGQVQPTSQRSKRHGLGQHGLVSRVPASRGQDTFEYEADAAVLRTLLSVKVLVWPWPEFGEQEAAASSTVAAASSTRAPQAPNAETTDLQAQLSEMAGPRIAYCASKLKKVWPEWGKPIPSADVPGGGLVMRECLLLSFLHAATALSQLCSEPVYGLWVIPPLREGLALAIVLFGPKHPLALRLINACQRVTPQASRPATSGSTASRPATSGSTSGGTGRRRGSGQPTGARTADVRRAGRGRPSSVPPTSRGTEKKSAPDLRSRATPVSQASSGMDRGRQSPSPTPKAPLDASRRPASSGMDRGRQSPSPAPKAKPKKEAATPDVTPRGRRDLTPKALDVPPGVSPALLHMQLNSPRAGHGRARQRSITPILRSRSQSLEREMRQIHSQVHSEVRRETRSQTEMRSQTTLVASVGLGHRLRARAAGGSKIGSPPPFAQSMPSTPRSQSPVQGAPPSREPIWQIAKRRQSERGFNARKAERVYEEALGL